jgi:hypothetical protein
MLSILEQESVLFPSPWTVCDQGIDEAGRDRSLPDQHASAIGLHNFDGTGAAGFSTEWRSRIHLRTWDDHSVHCDDEQRDADK